MSDLAGTGLFEIARVVRAPNDEAFAKLMAALEIKQEVLEKLVYIAFETNDKAVMKRAAIEAYHLATGRTERGAAPWKA